MPHAILQIFGLPLPQFAGCTRVIQKGHAIFRQGDPVAALYRVETGHVQMQRHTESGATLVIFNAMAGQTFAEAALFSDHYHCDAIAQTRSQITTFDKSALLNAIQNAPTPFMQHLAEQVQDLRQATEILCIPRATDRVYAALIAGYHTGKIKTLAQRINLTPEATYRALSTLHKQGKLVRAAKGHYSLAPKN